MFCAAECVLRASVVVQSGVSFWWIIVVIAELYIARMVWRLHFLLKKMDECELDKVREFERSHRHHIGALVTPL
jgi:hypothetical protein